MKKELQDKLFEKYPKIFKQKDLSMRETCMYWGIDCDTGWYKILDMLCSQLQWNTDRNNYPQVEAIQVKQKYGGLRFYYTCIPKDDDKWLENHYGAINGIVSFAEYLSEETCENCGSMDNITQTKGWITTLCEKCIREK